MGEAVGEAGGEAVAEAVAEADGDAVVAGAVRSKVVLRSVRSGLVASVPVRSVCDGGSVGAVGDSIGSSRSIESRTERAMAATAAPRKITGVRAAVSGKITHGESSACVRSSRR